MLSKTVHVNRLSLHKRGTSTGHWARDTGKSWGFQVEEALRDLEESEQEDQQEQHAKDSNQQELC